MAAIVPAAINSPSLCVVAVTGAASGLGHALTARLASSPHVRKVIAIDAQRGDIAGVTWRVADVRDPALAGRLAGVDVVVHADEAEMFAALDAVTALLAITALKSMRKQHFAVS